MRKYIVTVIQNAPKTVTRPNASDGITRNQNYGLDLIHAHDFREALCVVFAPSRRGKGREPSLRVFLSFPEMVAFYARLWGVGLLLLKKSDVDHVI